MKKILVFSTVLCMSATSSFANSFSIRGGISSGFNTDYIYSQDHFTGQEFTSDYGLGAMTTLTYTLDQGLWGHPVELGFQLGLLHGSSDVVTPPLSCGIDTYLGLISDCQDSVGVSNNTLFAEGSAMLSFGSGKTEFLAGIGALHVRNDLSAQYLFPAGLENFVQRDTRFTGAGIKLGARREFALKNGSWFQLEGFLGAYRGSRSMSIQDIEIDTGGGGAITDNQTANFDETITAYSLEISPSLVYDAPWAGNGSTFEVGLSYKRLFNVVDTRNVVDHYDPAFSHGNLDDDISYTTIFVGLSIPLK